MPERVLEPEECAALARSVAGLLSAPAPTDEGSFTLLFRTAHSEGWLNVWPEAREAGFHDHDGSSVGVHVLEGTASNDGISLDGNPTVRQSSVKLPSSVGAGPRISAATLLASAAHSSGSRTRSGTCSSYIDRSLPQRRCRRGARWS